MFILFKFITKTLGLVLTEYVREQLQSVLILCLQSFVNVRGLSSSLVFICRRGIVGRKLLQIYKGFQLLSKHRQWSSPTVGGKSTPRIIRICIFLPFFRLPNFSPPAPLPQTTENWAHRPDSRWWPSVTKQLAYVIDRTRLLVCRSE